MDIESPQWDVWESRFMALAEIAPKVDVNPALKGAKHYLCLYGDNGLSPEEEFEELEIMFQTPDKVKKVEIDTSFWQDTVLYIP